MGQTDTPGTVEEMVLGTLDKKQVKHHVQSAALYRLQTMGPAGAIESLPTSSICPELLVRGLFLMLPSMPGIEPRTFCRHGTGPTIEVWGPSAI